MAYMQAQRKKQETQIERGEAFESQGQPGSGFRGVQSNSLQAKLLVGGASTPAEQEADQIAAQVTGGASPLPDPAPAEGLIQRDVEETADGQGFAAGSGILEEMGASVSESLDGQASSRLGSRLGADFSGVQVHTDQHAQSAATQMSARAFTSGKHIYFNEGQYQPDTPAGQELLAHELTHTIQQGQVRQTGGIPVSQSEAPGMAQRGFFSVRKHFRKAVDERNENYEDYKKQSAWTRFKWAMKNPLAFTFGRMECNKKNTEQRRSRKDLIASLDPDTAMLPEEVAASGRGAGEMSAQEAETARAAQEEGAQEAENESRTLEGPVSEEPAEPETSEEHAEPEAVEELPSMEELSPERRAGGEELQRQLLMQLLEERLQAIQEANENIGEKNGMEQQMSSQGTAGEVAEYSDLAKLGLGTIGGSVFEQLSKWNDAKGMGNTLKNLPDWLRPGWLEDLNDWASSGLKGTEAILGGIAEGLKIGGGLGGMISGAAEVSNTLRDADDLYTGGDKQAGIARYFDLLSNIATIGKGGNTVAQGIDHFAKFGGGSFFGPISTGLTIAGGLGKTISGSIEVDRTRKVKRDSAALRDEYEEARKGAVDEESRKRLEAQAGFMRMGHDTARADQTRAGFKLAGGLVETVAGVASPFLDGGTGMVASVGSGISSGVKKVGGALADYKQTKAKRAEVDRSFHIEQEQKKFKDMSDRLDAGREDGRKVHITDREAKHVVLRRNGFSSRAEAYLHLARERQEMSKQLEPEERGRMLGALHLSKNATDSVVYQRLGLSKKDSVNVDRAILKQRKRRLLPSWQE